MTRALFRAPWGGALAGLLWGDYSSVASQSAILFGPMRYSHDDDAAADDFAIAPQRRAGISPRGDGAVLHPRRLGIEENRAYLPERLCTPPGDGDRTEHALQVADAGREAALRRRRPRLPRVRNVGGATSTCRRRKR